MTAKWSEKESTALMHIIYSNGGGRISWKDVAQLIKTKTDKQCMIRYHSTLKHRTGIQQSKMTWNDESDKRVQILAKKYCNNWDLIGQEMDIDRNSAKNRFYVLKRRNQDQVKQEISEINLLENVAFNQSCSFRFLPFEF